MQYSDKKPNITYSEFKFKDNPDTDEERHIMKLIRPTDLDSCQIALDPKKGQVVFLRLYLPYLINFLYIVYIDPSIKY